MFLTKLFRGIKICGVSNTQIHKTIITQKNRFQHFNKPFNKKQNESSW
jgi:hypothetical protein